MNDMFEYLKWRGDIRFSQLMPGSVDSLIFSCLAYILFDGVVSDDPNESTPLPEAAQAILSQPYPDTSSRAPDDLALLKAAAETERFGSVRLCFYKNVFIPQEETQFAAVTFLLEDGSAFLAFRGTDNSLVGWKEDFNMTFQDSVPAQRLAADYVRHFSALIPLPLRLGGHSKGGNLAVYAGAKCGNTVRKRILDIYNHDGPGFTEAMLEDPGYTAIVPRIRTFVPQSSVFGMLLERGDHHTIIKSTQLGLMQHDPYSWEVLGPDLVKAEGFTEDSLFLDRTFKVWLSGLTCEERSEFFDAVFELLMAEGAVHPKDVLRPQNILSFLRTMHLDEGRRKVISSVLLELVDAAKKSHEPQ